MRARPIRQNAGSIVGAAIVTMMASAAQAQANFEPALSVGVDGSYAANPFLLPGQDTASGEVQVDIRPTLTRRSPQSTTEFELFYDRTEYTRRYGATDAAGGNLNYSTRTSARSILHVGAHADSSIIGTNNSQPGIVGNGFVTEPIVQPTASGGVTYPIQPVVLDPSLATSVGNVGVLPEDLSLIGFRQRRNLISGDVGLNYRPTAHSTWDFDVNGSFTDYPGIFSSLSSYFTVGGVAGYKFRSSASLEVGGRASATLVSYRNGLNYGLYSPQAYVAKSFSEAMTLTVYAGVTVVTLPTDGTRYVFSAEGTLCRRADRSSICFAFSRAPAASGLSGIRNNSAASVTIEQQFARHSTLSLSGSFDGAGASGAIPEQRYWSANATLRHDFNRTIAGIVAVDYREINYTDFKANPDIAGRVGIVVKIGRRRYL